MWEATVWLARLLCTDRDHIEQGIGKESIYNDVVTHIGALHYSMLVVGGITIFHLPDDPVGYNVSPELPNLPDSGVPQKWDENKNGNVINNKMQL